MKQMPLFKKIYLLIFSLTFLNNTLIAQDSFPSYPTILRNFFMHYAAEEGYQDFTNFSKKKNGWYVQQIDRLNEDKLLSEKLFWSAEDKKYHDLIDKYNMQQNEEEAEERISKYLNGDAANLWNDYERCRYQGYNGWELDMIRDYGNEQNLPDSLLEGLARAYSSLSNSFLWYQQGSYYGKRDTMQIKLLPLQIPSEQRVAKVVTLISKSAEAYDRLEKQNPAYKMIVGNVHLKKFNELFHGYMQMVQSMQDEKAKIFIDKITLAEPYLKQARNYLNSCEKNAVLFTYGDNDTYQLMYVQEKENFRKDVAVINTSLLDLPVYVDMLKRKNIVNFSATPAFYGNKASGVCLFNSGGSINKDSIAELGNFLNALYSGKQTTSMGTYPDERLAPSYSQQKIILHFNNKEFNSNCSLKTLGNQITFELIHYIYLNDIIMLDIINTNINKRPICFASIATNYFDENLIQQGIVFRLFPLSGLTKEVALKKEIENLEKFTTEVFQPVIHFDINGAENFCYDGNNALFQLYSKIADYYSARGDTKKAAEWLRKGGLLLDVVTKENMPGGLCFANSYMNVNKEKAKVYYEIYCQYLYDRSIHPDAVKGYLSKKDCLERITSTYYYMQQEKVESTIIKNIINKLKSDSK